MCSDLLEDGVEFEIMLIATHVGLKGIEIVIERARHAALNVAVIDRPLPPLEVQGLARSILLREWQEKWDAANIAYSILSKVSLRPWFEGQMSGHCAARSHLSRFRIVEEAICVCA
jgi:hypothetical protein